MARRRISVRKIKETLRLRYECNLSQREVGRAIRVPQSTVSDYLQRAKAAGLKWPLPDGVDDRELNRQLFSRAGRSSVRRKAVPDWKAVKKEMSKPGVTRQLVWDEYLEDNPEGYSYSRFCELYRAWVKTLDPTMRMDHKAGEKAFIDYPGPKMPYIDPQTGEILEASLFVAVLGASNYTFCEAHASERLGDWIAGHVNAFEFWGGLPEILVPDNLKTGVKNPCRYEPDVNPTYHDMAVHYGVAVIPARVRAPRDKAKVENAVQVAERWVMAPLRNELFVGLGALNAAIRRLRKKLNSREMRVLGKSRREMFEEIDRPALRALPERPYELGVWKTAKVNIDYHVEYDKHYYSLPYELIHETVDVRATERIVEIFHHSVRVVSHVRSRRRGGHTTLPEHMPDGHRRYVEWTPERVERWAEEVGPQTAVLVKAVMVAREHPEQGFRSCLGIIRLADRYTPSRLEAASARALHFGSLSYKGVKNILDSGLDGVVVEDEAAAPPSPPHANVRGGQYYSGGSGDADATDA